MWQLQAAGRFLRRATLVLALLSVKIPVAAAQDSHPDSSVVIEVASVRFGVWRSADKSQFVRLTGDGTVVWDVPQSTTKYEHHSGKISAEEVEEITKRISSIDRKGILKEMGPYNTYKDTSEELKIYAHTSTGAIRFAVWNPWPGMPRKRMPENVKAWVCEVSKLRARFTGERLFVLCESPVDAKNK